MTAFFEGGGAVLAAGAVVLLLARYGERCLRWLASLRGDGQPHGYVPLMGSPDPVIPPRANAVRPLVSLPEPPPRLAGTPPPGEAGWPYTSLELTRDGDCIQATVSTSGRRIAVFAVDSVGGVGVIGTPALMAELQRQGSLAEIMEALHWQLPLEDLLAEVSRRAGQRPG